MLTSALAGLGLGLSLIVAIGAQNLFVLRQGLRREHVLAIAVICTLSDALLIVLGVSGIGLALHALPQLVTLVRWMGAAFLLGYSAMALRRAVRPTGAALRVRAAGTSPAPGGTAVATRTALAPAVLTCLALTWLNPHVYLDTVFLLGSVASTHGAGRWAFALGAMVASALWFFSLAFGARLLGRLLATPRAWRVLDAVIAVIMIALAVHLAFPG
ncbi:LysE/ArgO family amino acid transporter [Microbacterium kribbense]|uniref:LysE/ArgO family amino acid transporter n=1 Tax=Microbacterium kribbense TaxID=433645 RepID=A0ABP7GHP7_9MICO